MKKILLITTILFAPLSAYGQTYMSEEEMMERVVGHKLQAVAVQDGKTVWTEYYAPHKKGKPKGKIEGTWGGEFYKGTWKIKKGMWCYSYPKWSDTGCYYLEAVDETTLKSYGKDGKYINTITIVE